LIDVAGGEADLKGGLPRIAECIREKGRGKKGERGTNSSEFPRLKR